MVKRHPSRLVGVLAAGAMLAAAPAPAQYFGQNKVQYRSLQFQVLSTSHFDIYFYPREHQGAELSARLAERWYSRFSRLFDHQLRGRQPLILYASPTDFRQTTVISGQLGEGTGGVTEPLERRIVLPLGGPLADTNHVIGHELVHAFQFDITTRQNAGPGENGAERLPLWFIEGMAEYLSIGPVDPNTAMWLRDAVANDSVPAIKDLDNPKYFPYRWGQAFWAYVGGRWGDNVIPQLLVAASQTSVQDAFTKVLGVKQDALSDAWHASISAAYGPVLKATTAPAQVGRTIVKGQGQGLGADMNVGPSLSPDGSRLAFLSQRAFFSTDLYIADARSGNILRKLTSTSTDPHFSSIEFIDSAGAWNPDGTQIAIAAVTGGKPTIAIFDASTGGKIREIPVADVDEVVNPAWSPDGQTICFTGLRQGLTDLYLYDLKAGHLEQLTDDAYADLQPAWSPDGRRIAFATDRFTTKLDTLAVGTYDIAYIDPSNKRITRLQTFDDAAAINPQWSPDGERVYFISNRGGIPNLYDVPAEGGAPRQLTNVSTGISGITASSPALSVAAKAGTAAFSLYNDGGYDIHTLEMTSQGSAPNQPPAGHAGELPPEVRQTSQVSQFLESPRVGLPERQTFPTSPYHATLHLQGVGQPTIGIGADRFGTTIGGGVALQFADLLDTHELTTGVAFDSAINGELSIKDLAAQAAYLDQAHRWTWGMAGGQTPYLSGGFSSALGQTTQGEPVQIDQQLVLRQTERSLAGITAYPFDQARRVEFQGGFSQISFDQITNTTVYSLVTGATLAQNTQTTSAAPSLGLGTASAAYVFDTSNFGATSPVHGQRYRIEAAPTFGTIHFTSVLADYRHYFMPVPFYTIAIRAMHYGRYGAGGEDQRLFPLYIGYPQLVRGYDVNTFTSSECVPTAASQCPAFDRLLGSRFAVGNVEFRFPLLRPFVGTSANMYGPVPIEVALFADGGVAWSRGETPALLGGDRHGVSSAGVALRVNLLGFAVGEFSFARPFQRPGRGWIFQFSLTPGF
jgi:WD40-like Beta Propeller Repeat